MKIFKKKKKKKKKKKLKKKKKKEIFKEFFFLIWNYNIYMDYMNLISDFIIIIKDAKKCY